MSPHVQLTILVLIAVAAVLAMVAFDRTAKSNSGRVWNPWDMQQITEYTRGARRRMAWNYWVRQALPLSGSVTLVLFMVMPQEPPWNWLDVFFLAPMAFLALWALAPLGHQFLSTYRHMTRDELAQLPQLCQRCDRRRVHLLYVDVNAVDGTTTRYCKRCYRQQVRETHQLADAIPVITTRSGVIAF